MPRGSDETIAFRTLYQSAILSVREYVCHACRGGPAGEEQSESNNIVLMRNGAFSKHFGRRSVTADVNQVAFFTRGSTYRISHPTDGGDRGTVLVISPRVLQDIVRELDPAVDERPTQPFPFVTGPCTADVFWRHRELVQRLEAADAVLREPLWADVSALQLAADVLESAFSRHGLPPKRSRGATDADHIERAEAAKSYLASRIAERVTLEDVAESVHVSPFHLARIFQERTGVPVHRYLTRLRLRLSLDRLADGATDLTALALELGFSSHSHFADAFRREFGRTPSQVRRATSSKALREMSKNLKV
jgi:AraC family transcriptional regulator